MTKAERIAEVREGCLSHYMGAYKSHAVLCDLCRAEIKLIESEEE